MLYQLETLESLIEFNKNLAEKWFKENGSLAPMIIGYTRNNKQKVIIVGQFENDDEKQQWLLTAAAAFYLFDVDKYAIINEGWMVKDPTVDVAEIYKQYGSLENYPGRTECLNILAVNKHGAKMSISEILEDKTLKQLDGEYHSVSGRICELIPKDIPPLSAKKRKEIFEYIKAKGIELEDI